MPIFSQLTVQLEKEKIKKAVEKSKQSLQQIMKFMILMMFLIAVVVNSIIELLCSFISCFISFILFLSPETSSFCSIMSVRFNCFSPSTYLSFFPILEKGNISVSNNFRYLSDRCRPTLIFKGEKMYLSQVFFIIIFTRLQVHYLLGKQNYR